MSGFSIYDLEEQAEQGGDPIGLAQLDSILSSQRPSSFPAMRSNPQDAYWKGNAPVLETVSYNNESVMIPVLAPRSSTVTIRNAILRRTLEIIRNHSGGPRIDWKWRFGLLDSRLQNIAPNASSSYCPYLSARY